MKNNIKYKLIAVDIDGTLVDDKKEITPKNLIAINKAKELGVKFVICSGRIPATLRFFFEAVSVNQPVISCNGGIILGENKEIIYEKNISKENALKIVDNLRRFDEKVYYHFYDNDTLCSEKFDYAAKGYYEFCKTQPREYKMNIMILGDAKDYIINKSSKIRKFVVADSDTDYMKKVRSSFEEAKEGLDITSSGKDNIEIVEQGISKGDALEVLAKHYGISLEECIAIGNDENDLSMIKKAGLGVAMENSPEFVKDQSDYITINDNNNDGIAEVIEKFIL